MAEMDAETGKLREGDAHEPAGRHLLRFRVCHPMQVLGSCARTPATLAATMSTPPRPRLALDSTNTCAHPVRRHTTSQPASQPAREPMHVSSGSAGWPSRSGGLHSLPALIRWMIGGECMSHQGPGDGRHHPTASAPRHAPPNKPRQACTTPPTNPAARPRDAGQGPLACSSCSRGGAAPSARAMYPSMAAYEAATTAASV